MRDRRGYQPQHGPVPPRSFPPRQRPPARLPEGYLQKGYFDSKGNLWPEVVQQWPEELAGTFKGSGLASTQLRRFFNRARTLEMQLDSGTKGFDRLKEDLLILKTLAAASVGKRNAPELFKTFMDKNVDIAVKFPDEMAFKRGFLTHLQSLIAYLKYYETKKGGNR